ncbi:hypothetical protein AAVH_25217 [Aphelenchoides avenae]|nr:hypothetical protein AAVH_25217 [Aphelenchus avenae]
MKGLCLGQCPNATAGTVIETCQFACGCSCSGTIAEYLACVTACTARMTTQGLCAQLTDFPLGTGEGPCRATTLYRQEDVCTRTCACCNKPLAACSCANSPELALLRTACRTV